MQQFHDKMEDDADYFLQFADDQLAIKDCLTKFKILCDTYGYDFEEEVEAMANAIERGQK